jgi:crotonobetainyl-CoA:carnitine CoA-transferase CaiB-like acyl-CoA transferase
MDSDLHEGTRKAALRLLAETGLFRGAGAAKESDVASILANSLKLSGPTRPFIPTPWRATDALAGAQGAMAALCILLEGLKGRKETTAELDVEAGTFVALAQFLLNWEVPGGGYWHETTILFNKMLEEKLASSKPAASGVKGVIKPVSSSEELVDPPAGTSANSPLFHALRTFLGDVFPTKDRHIFLFMLSQDHPNKYLAAMGFNSDEVSQLIRLAITTPETHPKTFLAHHEDFLRQIKARLLTQMAFDVEERIRAIPAIAVVPRTREEFEKTEQGRILSQLPRMAVERANEVRGPRTVEEWGSVLSGKTSDGAPGLWPETGWSYGSIPAGLPTRGVLYGVKVLEITRIVAGPICGLQLAQLGADVMRISSADIFGEFKISRNCNGFSDRLCPQTTQRTSSTSTSTNVQSRWI